MIDFYEDRDEDYEEPVYDINDYYNVIHVVPIQCSKCQGGMVVATRHESSFEKMINLKNRFFHVCTNTGCRNVQSVDDFKKGLFTV